MPFASPSGHDISVDDVARRIFFLRMVRDRSREADGQYFLPPENLNGYFAQHKVAVAASGQPVVRQTFMSQRFYANSC